MWDVRCGMWDVAGFQDLFHRLAVNARCKPSAECVVVIVFIVYTLQKIHTLRKFTKSLTIAVNLRNYCFTQGFHEFPKNSCDFVKFQNL